MNRCRYGSLWARCLQPIPFLHFPDLPKTLILLNSGYLPLKPSASQSRRPDCSKESVIVREQRLANAMTAMGSALPRSFSVCYSATLDCSVIPSFRADRFKTNRNAVPWTSGRLCIFLGRVSVGSSVLNKFPQYTHSRNCARILRSSDEEGRLLSRHWMVRHPARFASLDNCCCFQTTAVRATGNSPSSS